MEFRTPDITGQKFGRLVALRRVGKPAIWLYGCDCGKKKKLPARHVRSGHISSCGCLHKEIVTKNATKHGGPGAESFSPHCMAVVWAK